MGMMRMVIHGNLVADPQSRETQNGDTVCNFSVACNIYRGRNAQPEAYYVRVSAWRGLAETCRNYLHKGSGVIVWGKAGVHAWNDTRDGHARAVIELEAEGMDFAGGRKDGSESVPLPTDDDAPPEMVRVSDPDCPYGQE